MQISKEFVKDIFVEPFQAIQNHIWYGGITVEVPIQI
jgi:hypothetical protein